MPPAATCCHNSITTTSRGLVGRLRRRCVSPSRRARSRRRRRSGATRRPVVDRPPSDGGVSLVGLTRPVSAPEYNIRIIRCIRYRVVIILLFYCRFPSPPTSVSFWRCSILPLQVNGSWYFPAHLCANNFAAYVPFRSPVFRLGGLDITRNVESLSCYYYTSSSFPVRSRRSRSNLNEERKRPSLAQTSRTRTSWNLQVPAETPTVSHISGGRVH